MKHLILLLTSFIFISCSQKTKVPEISATPKVEVKTELPESLTPVVKDMSAEQPPTNTVEGMPNITGTSILDVNCALAQDKRLISIIERSDAQGWGVVYHKFGAKKTIAIARNDKSFCEEVVARVKGKLQSAGFECDGKVSSSATPVAGDETSNNSDTTTNSGTIAEKSMVEKAKDAAASAKEQVKETAGKVKDGGTSMVDKAKEVVEDTAEAVKGE